MSDEKTIPITTGVENFGLRPGEIVRVYESQPENPGGIVLGIAMLDTPAFPGKRGEWPDLPTYAIVACYHYEQHDGWGFIALQPNTKDAFGDILRESNAVRGRWYWAVIKPSPIAAPAPARRDGEEQ